MTSVQLESPRVKSHIDVKNRRCHLPPMQDLPTAQDVKNEAGNAKHTVQFLKKSDRIDMIFLSNK